MVRGLELFRDRMEACKHQYVLIGGSACALHFEEAGLDFRSTRDLDVVLCVETLDKKFTNELWAFIRDGGYALVEQANDRPCLFRFKDPTSEMYPEIIELFSRRPEAITVPQGQRIIRVMVGEDDASLSAIMLDDAYYAWMQEGRMEVQGVSTVAPEFLMVLKAKAYLGLQAARERGERAQAKHIRKHRMDVFRLFTLLPVGARVALPQALMEDFGVFLDVVGGETVDMRAIGLAGTQAENISEMRVTFGLPDKPDRRDNN